MTQTLSPSDPTHSEVIRSRIMEAGEKSFARWGFAAASLRQITTEAGVNLAAVNYYFGSKENLYHEIIAHGIKPINNDRLGMLEATRGAHPGKPIPVEEILTAFCRPCFEFIKEEKHESLLLLLGKSMYENENFIFRILEREWKPVIEPFLIELHRTLPDLSEEELCWRFHFAVGAMIHTISQARALDFMTQGLCTLRESEEVLQHLVAFCAAGFKLEPRGAK